MLKKLLPFLFLIFGFSLHAQKKEKLEPHFIEIFFENEKGERKESFHSSNEFIYMVVETMNARGEKVTISFTEGDDEFIYKNKYVGPGLTFNFRIRTDMEKIKIKLYNPNNEKHIKLKAKALKKQGKKAEKIEEPQKVLDAQKS